MRRLMLGLHYAVSVKNVQSFPAMAGPRRCSTQAGGKGFFCTPPQPSVSDLSP